MIIFFIIFILEIKFNKYKTEAKKDHTYMIISDKWKDYEVLDASGGEKLERWGNYILIRPDPQVIWDTDKKNPGWMSPNAHYHRSSKGGGEWEFHRLPEEWTIEYPLRPAEDIVRPLTFRLKPFAFKHTGLFPEQAVSANAVMTKIRINANAFVMRGFITLSFQRRGLAPPFDYKTNEKDKRLRLKIIYFSKAAWLKPAAESAAA